MSLWKVDVRTDFGEFGNDIHNVFGYESVIAILDEAQVLMSAIEDLIFPPWLNIISNTAELTQMEVTQLDGSGYGIRTYSGEFVGIEPGVQSPPFVAWSFKLVKAEVGQRSGGKRFGPISMAEYEDRTPVGDAPANLAVMATAIGSPLVIGVVDTFFPVVLERPISPSTTWGSHGISGAVFNAVSTQNTRKK